MQEKFYSLAEAAKYAHVCRHAIFVAIRKKNLKAEKKMILKANGTNKWQWVIFRKDLDEYRASKYNRDKRVVDGEKLFDLENDKWSILHAAKTLSTMLGRHYTTARLYYLLRMGKIRGFKRGNAWVLSKDTVREIYYEERCEYPKVDVME